MLLAEGRSNGFRVPLNSFLNYARFTPATTIAGFLTGSVIDSDNTYYIGLLPLVLVFWGIFKLEKPIFIGLASAAIALFWLSLGGGFARVIYFFPGMMLYRHVGLVFGIAALLLILASGFVVDFLLEGHDWRAKIKNGKWAKLFKTIFLLIGIDLLFSFRKGDYLIQQPLEKYLLAIFLLRIVLYVYFLVYFHRAGKTKENVYRAIFIIFLFDVFSFQLSILCSIPKADRIYPLNTFQAKRLDYFPTRTNQIDLDQAGSQRLAVIEDENRGYKHHASYGFAYNWIGADPCYPTYRNDLWQESVIKALLARGGHPHQWNDKDFLPANDLGYAQSIGCGANKIRLIQNYISGNGDDDVKILGSIENPSEKIVIRDAPGENLIPVQTKELGAFEVEFFDANGIKISVNNMSNEPLWLYYADAYDSRWQAKIDEIQTKVYRANVGFKAVIVPPGRHDVVMEFTGGKFLSYVLAIAGIVSISFLGGWVMSRLAQHPRLSE